MASAEREEKETMVLVLVFVRVCFGIGTTTSKQWRKNENAVIGKMFGWTFSREGVTGTCWMEL